MHFWIFGVNETRVWGIDTKVNHDNNKLMRKYLFFLVLLICINKIYSQTKTEPDLLGLSFSYSYSFFGASSILIGSEVLIITTNDGLINNHNPLTIMKTGFYYKYSFQESINYLIINYSILPMIFPDYSDSMFLYSLGINGVYDINHNIFGIAPEIGISFATLFDLTYRYNIMFDKYTENIHEIGIKIFIELIKIRKK